MILGGAGLVGQSIARRLALLPIRPSQIILASRTRDEALQAIDTLQREQEQQSTYIPRLRKQPKLVFVPAWGDIFVRHRLANIPRSQLEQNPMHRAGLLEDVYGDINTAYEHSHLVHLLRQHRPNILVDAINTATGLSYRNAFYASTKVQQAIKESGARVAGNETVQLAESAEDLLLAQSVPALVRHVTILAKAASQNWNDRNRRHGSECSLFAFGKPAITPYPCQKRSRIWAHRLTLPLESNTRSTSRWRNKAQVFPLRVSFLKTMYVVTLHHLLFRPDKF